MVLLGSLGSLPLRQEQEPNRPNEPNGLNKPFSTERRKIMPLPLSKSGIPTILQNVSIAYRNRLYVGDKVFPIIPNCPPEAKVARYLKGAWFRDEAMMRGPGSEAARGGYPVDYLDIIPKEYAFAKEVTDEDRDLAASAGGPPLQPDQDAIEFATDRVLLKNEVLVAAMIKATSWSSVAAGGTDADGKWAAGSGNTFLADIKAKKALIQNATGLIPNCLLMDNGTYWSLTEESTVLDKIKYTQLGVLTNQLLAAILDLDEVMVAGAVTSTAKETKAGTEFTAVRIWEVTATKGMGFLFYRPPSPGLKIPSAGYVCQSSLYQTHPIVRTWREESKHQDVYEAAEKIDILASGQDLGYQWKDTLLT